jgi:hypothetical protein
MKMNKLEIIAMVVAWITALAYLIYNLIEVVVFLSLDQGINVETETRTLIIFISYLFIAIGTTIKKKGMITGALIANLVAQAAFSIVDDLNNFVTIASVIPTNLIYGFQ